MNLEDVSSILFYAVFALVVGSLIFKIIKHGGLKAAMFGAPIERTIGEVVGGGVKLMNIAVRVHKLGGGTPDKAIGIEFVAKSFASYQMMPVTLSVTEAKKLSMLLQSATTGSNEI